LEIYFPYFRFLPARCLKISFFSSIFDGRWGSEKQFSQLHNFNTPSVFWLIEDEILHLRPKKLVAISLQLIAFQTLLS
jgi:hypothetical protein